MGSQSVLWLSRWAQVQKGTSLSLTDVYIYKPSLGHLNQNIDNVVWLTTAGFVDIVAMLISSPILWASLEYVISIRTILMEGKFLMISFFFPEENMENFSLFFHVFIRWSLQLEKAMWKNYQYLYLFQWAGKICNFAVILAVINSLFLFVATSCFYCNIFLLFDDISVFMYLHELCLLKIFMN